MNKALVVRAIESGDRNYMESLSLNPGIKTLIFSLQHFDPFHDTPTEYEHLMWSGLGKTVLKVVWELIATWTHMKKLASSKAGILQQLHDRLTKQFKLRFPGQYTWTVTSAQKTMASKNVGANC